MKPSEKNKIESLLMTAYKLPYSATIFDNDYALSRQQQQQQQMQHNNCTETTNEIQVAKQEEEQEGKNNGDSDNDNEDNNDDDDDEEEEDDEEDATTTAETISSYQNVLTITKIQMQQRKKHPRKPQNRLIVTR